LGQSLVVSAQGVGCMGMSATYGAADEQESVATIHHALDRGVTLLDTANIYGAGHNEQLVGRAVAGRRDDVVIATKFGFVTPTTPDGRRIDGRPEHVHAACDESLARLGVDHIDLYFQHRVDSDTPIEETVGAMGELVDAGKVRFVGLSEAGPDDIRRAHATYPVAAVQSEWSLWTRDHETNGVLATTRELGIGFVAFSPLGRGFLSGAVRAPEDLEEGDMRRGHPRFQGENFARNLDLAEHVRALAQQKGCTASQLALAWVLAQGDDVVPIPGTRRSRHLDENLDANEIELDADDLASLEAAFPVGVAAGERYPGALRQAWQR